MALSGGTSLGPYEAFESLETEAAGGTCQEAFR